MTDRPTGLAQASVSPRSLTARGAATRARIVESAADLIFCRGVAGTSLDDVIEVSSTSKSQVYHYFADKDDLVRAVIAHQTTRVLTAQEPHLYQLDSMPGLRRWRDEIVERQRQRHGVGGCPIGSLASELADHSEPARELLAESFRTWEQHLVRGLERMRDRGELLTDADPAALASAIMAALQGGLLLAQTTRTTAPLEHSLDMALEHVEHRTTSAEAPGP
jgi:AcrR family transcriptional regulator